MNILIKFLKDFKDSSGWLTPLSIFLTILIVHLTANFKEFLSISKDIWCAVFYIGLVISFIWFFNKALFAYRNRNKIQIEYLINKIKNN